MARILGDISPDLLALASVQVCDLTNISLLSELFDLIAGCFNFNTLSHIFHRLQIHSFDGTSHLSLTCPVH